MGAEGLLPFHKRPQNLGDSLSNVKHEAFYPNVGFEVFKAVAMKSIIFWDMTPCSRLSQQQNTVEVYMAQIRQNK
jgi:hypothetical protein